MFDGLHRFLMTRSRLQMGLLTFVLTAAIGFIDYWTTYEVSILVFYLIPVGLSAWYIGPRFGWGISILGASVWLGADTASGHPYSSTWMPFWNASIRLCSFATVALLLGRLHALLNLTVSLARFDGLTGLLNARSMKHDYEHVAQFARRHRQTVSLGFIDLDDFKCINDNFGHQAGDEVLVAVATRLSEQARNSDLVGRVGGDEFVVLLPHTDLAGAKTFFLTLRASLIELASAKHWPIGFSVGVAVISDPPQLAETAFSLADSLMYDVKKSGKNEVRLVEFHGESGWTAACGQGTTSG